MGKQNLFNLDEISVQGGVTQSSPSSSKISSGGFNLDEISINSSSKKKTIRDYLGRQVLWLDYLIEIKELIRVTYLPNFFMA
jgi:hypothetical protein